MSGSSQKNNPRKQRGDGESGQAFVETLLMMWLLTLLLSAIIQVFLVHNYTYQMANNAYFSLFKDKAYGDYNDSDRKFAGFPNWPKKPLRTVTPLQQAGGRVHVLAGGAINWSEDDRAAVPMMPYFEDAIVEQLRNNGVTRAPVRLKIGTPIPGESYLRQKFLYMAMGTSGGFTEFFEMIGSIVAISGHIGRNYTDFTGGYSEDELGDIFDGYEDADDDLDSQDPENAQDAWDEAHGDFNHDGFNDACEVLRGNDDPQCSTGSPF